MEALSKARTAFHSAAAKAERVFTDLKSDRDCDKQSAKDYNYPKDNHEVKSPRWRSAHIKTKQDWQDRFKNIRIGRKEVEDFDKGETTTMAAPFYDENIYILKKKNELEAKASDIASLVDRLKATDANSIPPTSVVKQLAIAIETGKKLKSMKDFLVSSGDSSPIRERTALSLSAVKSLVLRDKEDKAAFFDLGDEDKVQSLICSLFDAEGIFLRRKIDIDPEAPASSTTLPRDIHGAPMESFVVKLAEVIGNFRTVRKMSFFWCRVVNQMKTLWYEEQSIPGIPLDEIPDLNSCLLYQQLQVLNCCLSRKKRRFIATESLDSALMSSSYAEESPVSTSMVPSSPLLYAKSSNGELVLRLGADSPVDKLTMLETGEPVYAPVTQEGPLLTEDLIKETEELVLRTGSMGAACSQLLSDMQAFKAANPGCILEDFVRWHSPPDWTEIEVSNDEKENSNDGDSSSTRGQLSSRMQKEGNLWRELWDSAKSVPAIKQAPLLDEDLTAESMLDALEDISPSELFEQLFISLIGLGLVLTERRLSANEDLSKLFNECKDYVVATCQAGATSDKADDLCQVYETIETMLLRPEDVLKCMKQQTEEAAANAEEPKSRFRNIFRGKGQKKATSEEQKSSEETPTRQSFSGFFDGKSSLFSKKSRKPETTAPTTIPSPEENTTPASKPCSDENTGQAGKPCPFQNEGTVV